MVYRYATELTVKDDNSVVRRFRYGSALFVVDRSGNPYLDRDSES
jgi:hypothetical protein